MDANVTQAVPSAVTAFGQGNLEAMIKAQQIWTAGIHDLSQTMAAMAQARLDQTLSNFKALSSVKSLPEAFELQSRQARLLLDTAMAETGRLTSASMKLAEQSMAPITAQMTAAVEAFKRPSA